MSTAELKQLIESIAISQRETDRIVKETSLSIKDTDRQMKETECQMKRRMDHLFRWMPEHRDKEFQGMVAYVEGSAAARQAVLAHGWHLVHVGEDLFDLKTPPGFVPKIYRADAR